MLQEWDVFNVRQLHNDDSQYRVNVGWDYVSDRQDHVVLLVNPSFESNKKLGILKETESFVFRSVSGEHFSSRHSQSAQNELFRYVDVTYLKQQK
jgi:hypothetical protein